MASSTLSHAPATGRALGRSYWYLWWAALVSGAGDGVRVGALPLVAAALSRRPEAVAAVWFAGGLPFVLVGPFTGVLTDRWRNRTRIMSACDLAAALAAALFAVLMAGGAADIALLIGLNFVLGSVQTLRDNAALTLLPDLVPPDRLDSANSGVQSAQLVTIDLLGPPAGALLVVLPAGLPFLLDSASFGAAALLVSAITATALAGSVGPSPAPSAAPRTSELPSQDPPRGGITGELMDGLGWLWQNRPLRTLCLLAGLSGMGVTAVVSIAVLYALQVLHVGHDLYALLLALIASAGVAGALLAPALSRRLGRGGALRLAFALGPPAFLVAAATSSAPVAALALTGVGASVGVTNVVTVSARQSLVPAGLRGRVNASYRMVAVGMTSLGAAAGGVLAQLWGLRAPFVAGSALFAVGLLIALRTDVDRSAEPGTAPRGSTVRDSPDYHHDSG
ncbi:MFS-type transporter involved in bile tolerance, Atg22 family [Actinacidiphila yanglinensis]|uniref:MFS-type transporter involved in bile tolerance, Atg22 family n=1 Tax=Actinacidiphila yanglinensis TaxID=310779 RepID=A0A1H6DGJ7_9ACTN|nr:MFS transporter [Actinacidiphila yanglinensis]SEG84359.1 MFS-type transporter involved in bile tolerance, Atg22 family [Actinacidiphila yanglinensis]